MNDLLSPAPLSVSQLNYLAADLLDEQLSGLWISGEIGHLTRASSGHYYFSLKDETAQVRCVLFKFNAAKVAPLREGDHVQLCGKVSIYAARGEFQITVEDVRPMGLGRLFEMYERLKTNLQAEGLFDVAYKKMLPENPKKIGVITSLAAAALRDVLTTLSRRAPHIPVIVYPTAVQGIGSEQQIVQAIEIANQRKEVDVLIVCRGGGSIEDLWAFNEECVVRAIWKSTLPIVSGVGHETDFTLTDFVADVRAATPTAAAELVSPNRLEYLMQLDKHRSYLQQLLQQVYQNRAQKLDFLIKQLLHPEQKIIQQKMKLLQFQAALKFSIKQQIAIKREQLSAQQNVLSAVSPDTILQRGFAIVRNTRGKVVHDVTMIQQGQQLSVQMASGEIEVQVLTQHNQRGLLD